eukprot:3918566-Pyramimonas_sp.AAC.1
MTARPSRVSWPTVLYGWCALGRALLSALKWAALRPGPRALIPRPRLGVFWGLRGLGCIGSVGVSGLLGALRDCILVGRDGGTCTGAHVQSNEHMHSIIAHCIPL